MGLVKIHSFYVSLKMTYNLLSFLFPWQEMTSVDGVYIQNEIKQNRDK